MKKIIVGLSLVLIILIGIIGNVNAANGSINLKTSKNEFSANEEFVVEASISGVTTDKGVAGLTATLEYDKESLTLVKTEGQNGWTTPNYNEANGKLITDKNSNVTGTENVLKFTFKVKANAKQNLTIAVKNASFSGGTGDITLNAAQKSITVKNGTSQSGNNTQTNNTISNNQTTGGKLNVINRNNTVGNKTNNTVAGGKIPQTGVNNTMLTFGGIGAVIIAAIFFVRMLIINKQIGK